jgi:hypothetical protein
MAPVNILRSVSHVEVASDDNTMTTAVLGKRALAEGAEKSVFMREASATTTGGGNVHIEKHEIEVAGEEAAALHVEFLQAKRSRVGPESKAIAGEGGDAVEARSLAGLAVGCTERLEAGGGKEGRAARVGLQG